MERRHGGSPRKGRLMDQSFFKEGRGQGFCPNRPLETTFILSSAEWCSLEFCLLCSAQPVQPGREAWLMQWGIRGEVSGHGFSSLDSWATPDLLS